MARDGPGHGGHGPSRLIAAGRGRGSRVAGGVMVGVCDDAANSGTSTVTLRPSESVETPRGPRPRRWKCSDPGSSSGGLSQAEAGSVRRHRRIMIGNHNHDSMISGR